VDPVEGFYEYGNELRGSIKGGEFHDQLREYLLRNKVSVPWVCLVARRSCSYRRAISILKVTLWSLMFVSRVRGLKGTKQTWCEATSAPAASVIVRLHVHLRSWRGASPAICVHSPSFTFFCSSSAGVIALMTRSYGHNSSVCDK
jgi:hypothetical protein